MKLLRRQSRVPRRMLPACSVSGCAPRAERAKIIAGPHDSCGFDCHVRLHSRGNEISRKVDLSQMHIFYVDVS
eukprot:3789942-Prymnesium_polylepis.1